MNRLQVVLAVLIAIFSAFSFLAPPPVMAQERTDLFLNVVPFGYYVDARAGEDNRFFLEIRNAGTTAVTDVKLSSDQPEGWTVEFEPSELDILGPGSLQTVDINIRPPDGALRGEHQISLIATGNEIRKVQTLTVDVELASYWVWVGVGVALVIVAVFVVVFVRVGRRREGKG